MKRKIIWGIVIVVVAAGIYLPKVLSRQPVRTAEARTGEIRSWVAERARTSLPRIHELSMPVGGRLLPIALEEGDIVTKGQVVARIQTEDLDAAVAAAEADLAKVESELATNRRMKFEELALEEYGSFLKAYDDVLASAREREKASGAHVVYAGKVLKSRETASAKGATAELEVWQARLQKARADVSLTDDRLTTSALVALRAAMVLFPRYLDENTARKGLSREALVAQVRGARAQLERARRDRGRIEIRSPADGVVLARHLDEERVLPAGSPLLDIGRRADLRITAEILTQEAVRIAPDQEVEITGQGLAGRTLTGRVLRVKPRAFTKLSSLGVEQQRVEVLIAFADLPPQSEVALGIGYRLRVRIFTARKEGVLVVSRRALVRGLGGRWHVFIDEGGVARRREVEVGLQNDDDVEITKGLEGGMRVVLSPSSSLADGDRISAQE